MDESETKMNVLYDNEVRFLYSPVKHAACVEVGVGD